MHTGNTERVVTNIKVLLNAFRQGAVNDMGKGEYTEEFLDHQIAAIDEALTWLDGLGQAKSYDKELQHELAAMQKWIDDLQSGMYINCVYCGHRYGPGETTPVSMADALKAHIEQCPKHPMSALKRELVAIREAEWERVPEGNYKTKHGDGVISYTHETNQLSVAQLKKRMVIYVGTLPDGWELRRRVKLAQENNPDDHSHSD